MDQEKLMIIVKDEDKTAHVVSFEVEDTTVRIVYRRSDKEYNYNRQSILILSQPIINEIGEDEAVFQGDFPLGKVICILDFGPWVRVCHESGWKQAYPKNEIRVRKSGIKTKSAAKVMAYWREISKHVKMDGQQSAEERFIRKQFANLSYVHPDSVLNRYLSHEPINTGLALSSHPIFPFRCNLSQKTALNHALKSSISVIQGPPGTGKTQTILNILANLAVMQKKKVAVVSGNNAAVQNVKEKLDRDGYGFFVASLGSNENKQLFFNNRPDWDVSAWKSDISEEVLVREIRQLDERIDELMDLERETATLKQTLAAYQLEQEHFKYFYEKQEIDDIEELSFFRLTSDRILDFMKDSFLEVELKKDSRLRLLYKFKLFFKHGFTKFDYFQHHELDVMLNYQRYFYELKISELAARIASNEDQLKAQSYQDLMNKHQELAEQLFRSRLFQQYHNVSKIDCTYRTYKRNENFKTFIEQYPIVLSTTHSLRNCVPEHYLFDYCIIDESSQVDLLTGALALSCCKQAIIVGDTKQLPQIVDMKIEERLLPSLTEDVSEDFNYFQHNVLSSMLAVYRESIPQVMLREHYRCHPRIIDFCNQKYYKGDLIAFTNHEADEVPLMIYRTVRGNHMRELTHGEKGKFNQRELDVIEQEILPGLFEAASSHSDIGFVTPYRKQVNKATSLFDPRIENDTIHKYQGREKELMIFSTVLDQTRQGKCGMKFVNDPCKINVAVSRAKNRFILVTDYEAFHDYGNEVGDLMRYMDYSTLDNNIVESQVVSVFDLLYKEYSDKLRSFREKARWQNQSRHRSENIMLALLEDILSEPEFEQYILGNQILLMNLFPDLSRLNDEEIAFVKHRSSVDFVIYYRMDKSAVFAIEVDGFAFHENNPMQLKRDKMKEQIFEQFNLKLHRFPTTGSGERELLRDLLKSALDSRQQSEE